MLFSGEREREREVGRLTVLQAQDKDIKQRVSGQQKRGAEKHKEKYNISSQACNFKATKQTNHQAYKLPSSKPSKPVTHNTSQEACQNTSLLPSILHQKPLKNKQITNCTQSAKNQIQANKPVTSGLANCVQNKHITKKLKPYKPA